MKLEWRKHERELYGVRNQPQLITIPSQNYIMIQGNGNPNNDDFSQRVGVLYGLAYPLKMNFKALCRSDPKLRGEDQYDDYTVYPLEGVWTTDNSGNLLDKDAFHYTIMIRQPDGITREIFEHVCELTAQKKPHPLLNQVVFGAVEDGVSLQILHTGAFDKEPETFAVMDAYARSNGLTRTGRSHREIYLNDPRKTVPEKRTTILRCQVQSIAQ